MSKEKKLSKNELLDYMEQAYLYFTTEPPENDTQAYEQIKSLIESSAQELSPRLEYDDNGNVVQIGISGGTAQAKEEPSEAEVVIPVDEKKLEEFVEITNTCQKPDRDVPKLICGHPLPCPHHKEE